VAITYDSSTIGTIGVVGAYPTSQILIPLTGTYKILFSAQCDCTNGTHYIEIFPVLNNVSVPDSNTRIALTAGVESCLTVEYFLACQANDVLEFRMTGDSTANASNARLLFVAAATGTPVAIPAVPSIIVTIMRIE